MPKPLLKLRPETLWTPKYKLCPFWCQTASSRTFPNLKPLSIGAYETVMFSQLFSYIVVRREGRSSFCNVKVVRYQCQSFSISDIWRWVVETTPSGGLLGRKIPTFRSTICCQMEAKYIRAINSFMLIECLSTMETKYVRDDKITDNGGKVFCMEHSHRFSSPRPRS